jgi:hypothetical protein
MLQRTERIRDTSPEHYAALFAESTETLEQMLEDLGVELVESQEVTPVNRDNAPSPGQ